MSIFIQSKEHKTMADLDFNPIHPRYLPINKKNIFKNLNAIGVLAAFLDFLVVYSLQLAESDFLVWPRFYRVYSLDIVLIGG
jgi:hypothetical protein